MMALQFNGGLQSVGQALQGATLAGKGLGGLVVNTKADHCQHHGDFISRQLRAVGGQPPRWLGCPQCANESGERALREQHDRDVQEAAQARAKALAERFSSCGVPRRYLSVTWENFRTSDTQGDGVGTQAYALRRARSYADNFAQHLDDGRTLMLLGNSGTGKNHLATCIARQVSEAGRSVVFITAAKMMKARSDLVSLKVPGRGELALLRDFAEPDLLVLDELFRQGDSDASDRFLFDVLNERYADAKPTLICSNKTLTEVRTLLDPALVSRLQEGGAIVIPFPWQDQRSRV